MFKQTLIAKGHPSMMYIFKTVSALQKHLNNERQQGKKIGFAPTMGALHQGHLSLIRAAKAENKVVVCSIFVNPTQFGEAADLEKYPRPIERDIELLEQEQCSVLFLPNVSEIYPNNWEALPVDLQGLDATMEGAHRPGHFAGVVQVVQRLLGIVQPHSLYMGQKDYQQFAIIKHMLQVLDWPINLVRIPIMRELDGLAMSSRNVRLSEQGRIKASGISSILQAAQEQAKTQALKAVETQVLQALELAEMEVDYFTIINGDSLQAIQSFEEAQTAVACITVRIDGVRLLDNIILRESH